ncbi:MAG: hypothetical protein R3308_01435, partial [Thiohalobacterales bacterium]|nr:hypothetical protein [Thiohalobacterales bacterium]
MMSIRPAHARWFELLTSRDELTLAVETLARTGDVELETQSGTHTNFNLQALKERLDEYNRLLRRYQAYWPAAQETADTLPDRPDRILDSALRRLHAWEEQAAPLVLRLEALTSEQTGLRLLAEMLATAPAESLDFSLLAGAG